MKRDIDSDERWETEREREGLKNKLMTRLFNNTRYSIR